MRAIGAEDSISPRKFLEVASNPEDSMLFYTGRSCIYSHFPKFLVKVIVDISSSLPVLK